MKNKAFVVLFITLMVGVSTLPVMAQDSFSVMPETESQAPAPQPSFDSILENLQETDSETLFIDPDFLKDDVKAYDDYAKVTLRFLNKITAESETHDLRIDRTVAYGSLRIRPKACKKSPPIEEPESASFLQVWEKTPNREDTWVFSGWMFASSPSLSPMEHPVYDIWVIDCTD